MVFAAECSCVFFHFLNTTIHNGDGCALVEDYLCDCWAFPEQTDAFRPDPPDTPDDLLLSGDGAMECLLPSTCALLSFSVVCKVLLLLCLYLGTVEGVITPSRQLPGQNDSTAPILSSKIRKIQ